MRLYKAITNSEVGEEKCVTWAEHKPIILALGRSGKEDQEFRVTFGYMENLDYMRSCLEKKISMHS